MAPDWNDMKETTRMNLGLAPANERRLYFVMMYLIGWEQAQNCKAISHWLAPNLDSSL